MVLGNQEFYGREYTDVIPEWRRRAETHANLYVFDRGEMVLDGARFLGATLWTDFDGCRPRRLGSASSA